MRRASSTAHFVKSPPSCAAGGGSERIATFSGLGEVPRAGALVYRGCPAWLHAGRVF